MTRSDAHFWPADGAILDQQSLAAIADSPSRLIDAFLRVTVPGESGLILEGLDLVGALQPIGPPAASQSAGPPGTRRPESEAPAVTVTPGVAILRDAAGNRHVVEVPKAVETRWPDATRSAVQGALVMRLDAAPGTTVGGLTSAHRVLRPRIGFAAIERLADAEFLPIAVSVGNGRDWATDYARIYQPESEVIVALVRRIDEMEKFVWRAQPEGSVWDRGILGRNWVQYQTVAASALQAVRINLESRAMTTLDRVRLLRALRRQLGGSVERVANEMLQIIGPAEAAGPYRDALDATVRTS